MARVAKDTKREAVRAALLDMLDEMPLSKVRVTDLCRRAGINRSTYYYNYGYYDPDDLLDELVEEAVEGLLAKAAQTVSLEESERGVTHEVSYIFANQRLFRTLFSPAVNDRLSERYRERYVAACRALCPPEFNKSPLSGYYLDHLCAGRYAILRRWVIDGCALPVEKVTGLFKRLERHTLGFEWE